MLHSIHMYSVYSPASPKEKQCAKHLSDNNLTRVAPIPVSLAILGIFTGIDTRANAPLP